MMKAERDCWACEAPTQHVDRGDGKWFCFSCGAEEMVDQAASALKHVMARVAGEQVEQFARRLCSKLRQVAVGTKDPETCRALEELAEEMEP
jgi:hypothetical protein